MHEPVTDHTEHVDPLDIVTYARAGLPRRTAERVYRHLLACEECADLLASVMDLRRRCGVERRKVRHRPAPAADPGAGRDAGGVREPVTDRLEHPDPLDLVAYARDGLPRGTAQQVYRHLLICSDCGDQLAAVIALRRRFGLDRRMAWYHQALAATAAVSVIIAGMAVVDWWTRTPPGAQPVAAVADRAAVAAEPEAPAEGPVTLRDRPDFRTLLIRTLPFVLRSAYGQATPAEIGSTRAWAIASVDLLKAGDWNRLQEIAAPYAESDPVATALLGLARYMAGDSEGAFAVLESMPVPDDSFNSSVAVQVAQPASLALAAVLIERGNEPAARALLSGMFAGVAEGEAHTSKKIAQAMISELDGSAAR